MKSSWGVRIPRPRWPTRRVRDRPPQTVGVATAARTRMSLAPTWSVDPACARSSDPPLERQSRQVLLQRVVVDGEAHGTDVEVAGSVIVIHAKSEVDLVRMALPPDGGHLVSEDVRHGKTASGVHS